MPGDSNLLPECGQSMFTGLWRNSDFLKLWTGQTASQVGSFVRLLALPLTAILTLEATPFEVGVLVAAGGLPALVIGVFAGAYIDRHRRRSVLIAADWLRALVIASVPVVYFMDSLQMWMLYLVALIMGMLALVFDVAYRSYLPSLVTRSQLIEGNSKLELSRSAAEVTGPGIGGAIVEIASAPVALIVDAASFAISAVSLHTIRRYEETPESSTTGQSLFREAVGGMRYVWRNRLIRPLVLATASVGFFNTVIEAAYLLYMTDNLEISPGLIGAIFATGGAGLLLGAVFARWAITRFGFGPSIIAAMALVALSDLALPLAGGPLAVVLIVLVSGQVAFGIGLTVYRVAQISLSQSVTDNAMQGRMNAMFQVALTGSIPFGALVGGISGELLGLRTTLLIGVAGEVLAVTWLIASPLRSVRELPEPAPGP